MNRIIAMLSIVVLLGSCSGDDDSSCIGAAARVETALEDFATSNTDQNCLELKAALENQRDVCGSLSSTLTTTLADLNCDN